MPLLLGVQQLLYGAGEVSNGESMTYLPAFKASQHMAMLQLTKFHWLFVLAKANAKSSKFMAGFVISFAEQGHGPRLGWCSAARP